MHIGRREKIIGIIIILIVVGVFIFDKIHKNKATIDFNTFVNKNIKQVEMIDTLSIQTELNKLNISDAISEHQLKKDSLEKLLLETKSKTKIIYLKNEIKTLDKIVKYDSDSLNKIINSLQEKLHEKDKILNEKDFNINLLRNKLEKSTYNESSSYSATASLSSGGSTYSYMPVKDTIKFRVLVIDTLKITDPSIIDKIIKKYGKYSN